VVHRKAGAAGEGSEPLERALEEREPEGDNAAATVAGVVDDVSEVTAKIERAVSLGKGVAEGKALAWALRDERVTSLVIGASSVDQLEQNVAALDNFSLSADELAERSTTRPPTTSPSLGRCRA
jgi:aryl-alcohol dehydrogenase-like predicted oxidoreductase